MTLAVGQYGIWPSVMFDGPSAVLTPLSSVCSLRLRVWAFIYFMTDVSWKPVQLRPNDNFYHTSFGGLAALEFPQTRALNLRTPIPSPRTNVSLEPNEHLLCYDFLYYVASWEVQAALRYTPEHNELIDIVFPTAVRSTRARLQPCLASCHAALALDRAA
jgi:hypothetical protein